MRATTFSRTIPYRRYAAIAIAGAAAMLFALFVFAEGVALIGTDVLPAKNWRRLDTHQMLLRHQLNTLRESSHIVVFGTSRNNMLSPEYLKRPALNLNYVYGTPREILKCLRSLDPQQIRNIEKIYMLVDYHTLEKGRYPRELDLSFGAYIKDTFKNFTLHRARVGAQHHRDQSRDAVSVLCQRRRLCGAGFAGCIDRLRGAAAFRPEFQA